MNQDHRTLWGLGIGIGIAWEQHHFIRDIEHGNERRNRIAWNSIKGTA